MKMKTVSSVFALAILAFIFPEWSCALTPASSKDGSGVDAPEVIRLQYCIVDNSTILRLDTGEQLNIVYTKDSTLVVTMKGFQTAIEVPRLHDELVCSMDNLPDDIVVPIPIYIYMSVWTTLVLAITGYNIIIHLLYKRLRNPIGKLLMLYSIFLAVSCVSFFMILTFIFMFPINLNYLCNTFKLVFVATDIGYEATATCILVHSMYYLRRSYKMLQIDPEETKVLLRRYFCYIIGTVAISLLAIVTYDVGTAEGRHFGYCSKHDSLYHAMLTLMYTISTINSLIQIALFIVFLYYWYKMRNSRGTADYQINKRIFRIAVAMGATISIANFFFFINWINARGNGNNLSDLAETIGSVMLLLQHFIIVGSLRRVKQMYKMFCQKESATNSE